MKTLIFFVIGLAFLSGCQTVPYQGQARDVKLKPQKEGIISIPVEFRDEDKAKAQLKMKQNCAPFDAQVLEEGEVAVGEKTDSTGTENKRESSEYKMGSFLGVPVMGGNPGGTDLAGSTTKTAIKEWQISYKCDPKTAKR